MVEVQKDDCRKPLEQLFGLTNLTKAFLKIDTNGDHIITIKRKDTPLTKTWIEVLIMVWTIVTKR